MEPLWVLINSRLPDSIGGLRVLLLNDYQIYILKSAKSGKLYKGYSSNLRQRLIDHNSGKTKSTKSGISREIVYTESYRTLKRKSVVI